MNCMKSIGKSLRTALALVLVLVLTLTNVTVASAAVKSISVKVNPVSIIINLKPVKIDSFEYGGKYYIQMQDVCSYLDLDYSYVAKTKTLWVNNQKPEKPVSPAKSLFAGDKPQTIKKLSVNENPLVIKIDNKQVKLQHFLINGNVYFSARDIATQLDRDFAFDASTGTLSITDKVPTKPVLKPSTTEQTDKDVLVTIDNWGSAVKKEYKINDGDWQPYSAPVSMNRNGTLYARGTNGADIQSEVASLEVKNIRKLLSKVEVSQLSNWAVKIFCYDINGRTLGTGSGFIVTSDGKIVTNFHVVDMVPIIKVMTSDESMYDVIGMTAYDAENDIAILKIDAKELPVAVLGDSSNVVLGEEVVTFGYPLGKGLTVTFGNVSSLNANSSRDIQISAPISPGNSGGPLLNMYGEVVGVNYLSTINAQNMNYAIPINKIKPLLAANTAKALDTVIKEVYPTMSELELEYYLYCNYPVYGISDYAFSFSDIYLTKDVEYPDDLYVELYLDAFEYGEVLMAEFEGNRAMVEKWVDDIYRKVKAQFPNRNVYVGVLLSHAFSVLPQGYASYEVYYNPETELYEVFRVKLWYGYENNQLYLRWY